MPVEVKSKKGTAKSMRTLIASDSYPEIQFGVKLSAGNIGSSEHVFTAPYFTTFLLRRLLRAYDEGRHLCSTILSGSPYSSAGTAWPGQVWRTASMASFSWEVTVSWYLSLTPIWRAT